MIKGWAFPLWSKRTNQTSPHRHTIPSVFTSRQLRFKAPQLDVRVCLSVFRVCAFRITEAQLLNFTSGVFFFWKKGNLEKEWQWLQKVNKQKAKQWRLKEGVEPWRQTGKGREISKAEGNRDRQSKQVWNVPSVLPVRYACQPRIRLLRTATDWQSALGLDYTLEWCKLNKGNGWGKRQREHTGLEINL